jgi:hypothetical protein
MVPDAYPAALGAARAQPGIDGPNRPWPWNTTESGQLQHD